MVMIEDSGCRKEAREHGCGWVSCRSAEGVDGLLLYNRSVKDRSRGAGLGSSWLSFTMGCFMADRESFLAAGLDERPVGKDGEVMRVDDESMQAWLELEKI